jgi:formylglycine-generating enzyme required for sulfatase activity
MVFVGGGTFTMGCTPEQAAIVTCAAADVAHNVTLNSFSIGKYEVTQAQWKAVMAGTEKENIFYWGGNANGTIITPTCGNVPCDDQRPVEYITWYEVVEFCNTLSKKVGLKPAYTIDGTTVTLNSSYTGYRLPTEAEWEYAARGCKGNSCEGFVYPGSNTPDELGWHGNNSSGTSHPVGQKKPNRLGIYDMAGNVWEWCYDWYGAYSNVEANNPTGPLTGSRRLIRGGSYLYSSGSFRVGGRVDWAGPGSRVNNFGFRVVLPAQ